MREIIKRHKQGAVQAGEVALPKSLQVLRQLNFVALLERHNNGKRSWRVELSSKTAKCLINASNELQQLKKENEDLTFKNSTLEMELAETQEEKKKVERINQKLMDNIKELQQLKKENEDLTLKNSTLEMELAETQEEKKKVERINQKLMDNIEADKRPEKGTYPRSPKSYLNIAEEKGMKVKGLLVQGGLPSLGKRR